MEISNSRLTVVQPTQKPTQQQAQVTERAQRQPETDKSPTPAAPTPVVNTQGQTTGRLVNVTA